MLCDVDWSWGNKQAIHTSFPLCRQSLSLVDDIQKIIMIVDNGICARLGGHIHSFLSMLFCKGHSREIVISSMKRSYIFLLLFPLQGNIQMPEAAVFDTMTAVPVDKQICDAVLSECNYPGRLRLPDHLLGYHGRGLF